MPAVTPTFVQGNVNNPSGTVTTIATAFTGAQGAADCNLVCIDYHVTATAWNSGTAYVIGNTVLLSGNVYTCILGNTNHTPPNTTYWIQGVISSVVDTAGNTYTVAAADYYDTASPGHQAIYAAPNIAASDAGANTVTVTFGIGVTHGQVQIVEYSNVNTVSPVDVSLQGGDINDLNPQTATTMTTLYPNDRIVSFLVITSSATVTVPTGYTLRTGSGTLLAMAADGPATNPGTYKPIWGLNGSRGNIVGNVALTPPPLPPTVQALPATGIPLANPTLCGSLVSEGTTHVTSYGFNWGLTSGYGTTITLSGDPGVILAFSSELPGLPANTTYHFQAWATSPSGSATSTDSTFTTNPNITPPTIVSSDPNGITNYELALTFAEEFNSPLSQYDSTLLEGTWQTWFYYGTQAGSAGRVEGSVNCLFSDLKYNGYNPFTVDGSSDLVITVAPNPAYPATSIYPYLSGTITTQPSFSQTYGYFECRCKVNPIGVGVWPAFWMLSETQQAVEEMDVMECFAVQNQVASTLHYLLPPNPHGLFNDNIPVSDVTQFHTYGMLWTATYIYFYVDEIQTAVFANPGFNDPEYMLATLQTGSSGSFLGTPTAGEIATPITFTIDYIRAYSIESVSAIVIAQPVSGINLTGVTLNGKVTAEGTPPVTSYGFNWGPTNTYGTTVTFTGDPGTVSPFSSVLTGLSSDTTYHFQAWATNGDVMEASADVTFTTASIPNVISLGTSGNPVTEAILNGELTLHGGTPIISYGFNWGLTSDYGNTITFTGDIGLIEFYGVINGLSPGTAYHFQAFATNSFATGTSDDSTFTTGTYKSASQPGSDLFQSQRPNVNSDIYEVRI